MSPPREIGRYQAHGELASGGMATVYFGRLIADGGFTRAVAIKAMLRGFADDPELKKMFLDEARLAARIRHPNVVQTLDVVAVERELFLVLDYVHGETLARLIRSARRAGEQVPIGVAIAVVRDTLLGLQAAHDATDELGAPLGVIHRDISPQNIIVGADGCARVLDFGVAKAAGRLQTTKEGQIKGKLPYMAPEQFRGSVSQASDVYAAGVVLWEALVGRRLFKGEDEAAVIGAVLRNEWELPSQLRPEVPAALDKVIGRALVGEPTLRFATAADMAKALVEASPAADATAVGAWVRAHAVKELELRANAIRQMESTTPAAPPPARAVAPLAASAEPISNPLLTAPGAEPSTQVKSSRGVALGIAALGALAVAAAVAFASRSAGGSAVVTSDSGSVHSAAPIVESAPALTVSPSATLPTAPLNSTTTTKSAASSAPKPVKRPAQPQSGTPDHI
jgi:serine/threonine-protein kinase